MAVVNARFFDSGPRVAERQPRLRLFIIFTGQRETAFALRSAAGLARGLGARATLLMAQVVPYPLPLDAPPVAPGFATDALAHIARGCGYEIDISVQLCRDATRAIRGALDPQSLIVLAARKRWWPDRASRLARALSRDGHNVLVVDSGRLPSPDFVSICPHR